MSIDALVEGIRKHIAQGDTADEIRLVVLEAGYTREEFADAYARATDVTSNYKVFVPPQPAVGTPTPVAQTAKPQVAEPEEKQKSPVFAIVLLVVLSLFVLGAVGFYLLNPDFIRDFATSRIEASAE